MPLYTPPPSSGPLNSSLPTLLPHELVHACNFASLRVPQKVAHPLTPPVSARRTQLPSIKHFQMAQPEFDEDEDNSMSEDEEFPQSKPSPDPLLSDWVSSSCYRNSQSSLHIAEKTCEMVCYLWFSTNAASSPRRRHPPYYVPDSNSSTASLQFSVSPNFVQFMQKVLETTQVSQSVIVLSLHYIYRLKERNRLTNGESGSEFRVAVAALMMANKFVDDNTYTNKTWSDVSGIPLTEINKMEREILLGIDFSLYVDKTTYESWLNLLKGLVMAKEKDSVRWRRTSSSRSRCPRGSVSSNVWTSANRFASAHSTPARPRGAHRARSTSPPMQSFRYPFTFTAPNACTSNQYHETPTKPGAKRSAADAFSPTSASFPPIKQVKRPTGVPALSVTIPVTQPPSASPHRANKSHSPMDLGLHKLTLAGSPAVSRGPEKDHSTWVSSERQQVPPKTLSAPWAQERGSSWTAPQNLYYYSLACSPASREGPKEERAENQEAISVAKKAKLRYHPAPQAKASPHVNSSRDTTAFASRTANRLPTIVHSASTSPAMRDEWLDYRHAYHQSSRPQIPVASYVPNQYHSPARMSITSTGSTPSSVSISTPISAAQSEDVRMEVPTLPPFNELVSGADVVSQPSAYPYTAQSYDNSPVTDTRSQSRYSAVPSYDMETREDDQVIDHSNGPQAAPFANAGPPGVYNYGYGYNGQTGSWDLQQSYYNAYGGYGSANMAQHAATAGWVRTR